MGTTSATILIPDISGFTEFMTTTELSHGSQAINMLIDAIVAPIGDEYEVAEIEGDAVLMIRKGPAPSKKEIFDTCLMILNSFHAQRRWIQEHSVCPCGACLCIDHLTVKFIVHHGPVAEIKVGRFVKQSGTDVIVAHRLLKNGINNHEYLLITEKLLQQVPDSAEALGMEWVRSSEQYNSIGKVEFQFAELNAIRQKNMETSHENQYQKDNTVYNEIRIGANFRDVYMVMMNIPGRSGWLPGLQKVEQANPGVYVGSVHQCTFDNFDSSISPLNMTLSEEGILYAESFRVDDMDISLIHEFFFRKVDDDTCDLLYRSMNAGDTLVPDKMKTDLSAKMETLGTALKAYCENMEVSFFDPAFQKI
jgi:class 3 adenylate cyclase